MALNIFVKLYYAFIEAAFFFYDHYKTKLLLRV